MQLPRCWFGVDIIATLLRRNEIFIHSANGQRVNRPLRRVASRLGFDRRGEHLFTGVVKDVLAGPDVDCIRSEGGLECHTHWIKAPDGTAVGLVIWLATPPVEPRPVYNSWILDLQEVATRSGGDNLSLIGTDRLPGENRPIRDLLRHMNPDDAGEFLTLHYDATTGPEGTIAEASWSVRPADHWVHFWSTANAVGAADSSRRTVYGLTTQLSYRQLDTRMGTLVRYTGATLLMVDVHNMVTVTTSGELTSVLDDDRILAQVIDQIDPDRIPATSGTAVEQVITIEAERFAATAFAVTSTQKRPNIPIALLLVPIGDAAG
jgi:hypothetical protein